ncbi:unnamed protein product [Rhizoctonia solani]|uniref:Uncharacterized protein n=3 Tax=Rhizoctonia solani TaxID=456999 RepID=A0A8H3GRN1_9AGAM|nr:2-methylcitrate dehydratase, putative [Rhizoctonia solani AG-3 Rhs1AP]KEP50642.1 putative 2-methylcitrate dehydratase [Rhizoctonia solani 123E]CAE6455072.1 unnamed protein product [Rhizoctonia solani]CAE6464329.1 unnamed protein product [Rhizoctonia solani]
MCSSYFSSLVPTMTTTSLFLPLTPPQAYASITDDHGLERPTLTRQLGCNELSYYLPSRADGVNDMYLHLGFHAPSELITPPRVHAIWATQRLKHPLLASRIETGPDASCARFEYVVPETVEEAIQLAAEELSMISSSKDDLLSNYLNGPRLLSAMRTSFLIIARDPEHDHQWHLMLCAMHCIGDGMALHTCANEMLLLLGVGGEMDALRQLVASQLDKIIDLPRSMEAALPAFSNKFGRAIAMVDDKLLVAKQIGGQAFPKTKGLDRKTVVPTVSFDEDRTKRILSHCKANGVSVSSAIFALCNIAWARMLARGSVSAEMGAKLPILMYTALNTRPWLDQASKEESFFRLNIGYFNVILPSFVPSDSASVHQIFWHRARLVREQSSSAVKSPFIVARTQITAHKREEQAIKWAKIDDEEAAKRTGLLTPVLTPVKEHQPALPSVHVQTSTAPPALKPAPSTALMGLSLLGNLDGIYKHASYGAIKLTELTTGSRQRAGAMLLFSYTFVGKLWLCFGYDENGFERGVVEEFWNELLHGVDEILGA